MKSKTNDENLRIYSIAIEIEIYIYIYIYIYIQGVQK